MHRAWRQKEELYARIISIADLLSKNGSNVSIRPVNVHADEIYTTLRFYFVENVAKYFRSPSVHADAFSIENEFLFATFSSVVHSKQGKTEISIRDVGVSSVFPVHSKHHRPPLENVTENLCFQR